MNRTYDDAFRLIGGRAHFMPLFTHVQNCGLPRDLNWKQQSDDGARSYLASWK